MRLTDPRSRAAVEVAERFAEGEAGEKELERAHKAAWVRDGRAASVAAQAAATPLRSYRRRSIKHAAFSAAEGTAYHVVQELALATEAPVEGAEEAEKAVQCSLLRDIFGPRVFRPVRVDRAWMVWNDATPRRLARAIFDDRAFERLPILADALEEAGCADADILSHCREPQPHVRGCWVLDALLGK